LWTLQAWPLISDAEDLRALKSQFRGELQEAVIMAMTAPIAAYNMRMI
jgi:hypothetical protein